MTLGELTPSLVTYLEAATTQNEAFKVLEKAVETLTDHSNTVGNELSSGFMAKLSYLVAKKGKKPVPEAVVNVKIANHVLGNLTNGYAILNKDHYSSNLMKSRRVFLPNALGCGGLALGK